MGLQTQVGGKNYLLHRLELPVLLQQNGHYVLLTEVGDGRLLLADPQDGWVKLNIDKARSLGEKYKLCF